MCPTRRDKPSQVCVSEHQAQASSRPNNDEQQQTRYGDEGPQQQRKTFQQELTISRSGDLRCRRTQADEVLGRLVHTARRIQSELLESCVVGLGRVDGGSSFPGQAGGRARAGGGVGGGGGGSKALGPVVVVLLVVVMLLLLFVQVHRGGSGRGHGLGLGGSGSGGSNQGDDLCHFEAGLANET